MRVTSRDILSGPIGPTLRRMTGPMVIGIMFTMLFQTVDTFFISRLGTAELAAISFTFPVTFAILNLIIGLGIAMSIIVGKAIGQGRHNKAARITTESLVLTLLITFVIAVIGVLCTDWMFAKMGASATTLLLIHEYLDVWFLFAVLLAVPIMSNSAIRATGDTKWPSILMMIAGLVNVVLDPIFIFGWGPIDAMGMAGAAWATVWSWLFACTTALYLLGVREKLLVFKMPPVGEVFHVWREVIVLAAPISLANMLGPIAVFVLTAIVARFGEGAVAAFGVGGRIEAFSLVVAFAITAALSPYVAQNIGANNVERAREAVRLSTRFIFVFQLAAYALQFVAAPFIAMAFSDDPAVTAVIIKYLRIMPLAVVCYAVIIVINTAFNAWHQSGKTLALSVLRVVGFVVPLSLLGANLAGINGLFAACVIANALGLAAVLIVYQRMRPSVEAPVSTEI
ncbi:MAG: MATE family efflux transporter [Gammaproteobacteria bacterium]